MSSVEVIDTTAETIGACGFCGFKDAKHEGYRRKVEWLKKRFAEGMRFKVLRVEGEGDVGMIEYIPGEHTWRPIEAPGYLVVHCIMIHRKDYKGRGYGSLLLEHCLQDAEQDETHGVAVVTSAGTWMADRSLFVKQGFEPVDTAPPSFELLVKKLQDAPSPQFKKGWEKRLRAYGSGLTIVQSDQCPCIAKSTRDILDECEALGIRPRVVDLKDGKHARNAPSAYGIFNLVYDGKLLADHPVSGTRFHNIMRGVAK